MRADARDSVEYMRWLSNWHNVEKWHDKRHACADSSIRLWRIVLAQTGNDEILYDQVISELGDCQECWMALLRLATAYYTSGLIVANGGREVVSDSVATELEKLVMP